MTENRGAEQEVTLLEPTGESESMEKVFTERCNLLTRAF
jgi:hypothetical protein